MGLLEPRIFFNNIELLCNVHIFICWYDSKGDHSLVLGKMLNGERKAILHVRRKVPSQCKYSFSQTSVLQQNTTMPALGEY